jgi:hypothetical protein
MDIEVKTIDYLRMEMTNVVLKKALQKVTFLSRSAIDTELFLNPPDLSADAVHIYASIPFNATHALTVHIAVVPFSIPVYRDQIFYHVNACYAKCCYQIEEENFKLFLSTAAEELYGHYIRHHSWNFRSLHSWFVHLSVNLHILRNRLRLYRRQIQVPEQVRQTNFTCVERSSLLLRYLIPEDSTQNCLEQQSFHFQDEDKLKLALHQGPIYNATLIPCLDSPSIQIQNECSSATTKYSSGNSKGQSKNEHAILQVAEEFVRNVSNTSVASIATDLVGSLCKTDAVYENGSELTLRAFECYISIARQSMAQLKHFSFTRFVSLCFFLIWEKHACKAGKAGARVVCTRQI